MVRPPAATRLLFLAAALFTATRDVTVSADVTSELLTSALKEVDDFTLPDTLRDGSQSRLTQLLAGADWRSLADTAARASRSPQEEPPPERRRKGRRRKGGRRRGGRRRGRKGQRRRRPTTPAPETSTTGPRYAATVSTTVPTTTTTTTTTTPTPTTTTTTTPPPTTTEKPNFHIAAPGTVNQRPVVGLLTQSLSRKLNSLVGDPDLSSYIDSSYVKFLESSGARVVPVMADQSNHYYREMFRYLNGLLIPGGASNLEDSGFAAAAKALWKITNEYSDDHFPILGIGQGMELLARLADPGASFRECPATNVASRLDITPAGRRSRLLGGSEDQVRAILSSQPATVTFHGRCLRPGAFRAGQLGREFDLVATSRDSAGAPFVSVIEHERKPVFGVAFQPEKPQFEWSRESSSSSIPHTAEAILAAQHIGNAFIGEVRKSRHRFPSPELEEDYLIFNYEPEFVGRRGADFTSYYFFL